MTGTAGRDHPVVVAESEKRHSGTGRGEGGGAGGVAGGGGGEPDGLQILLHGGLGLACALEEVSRILCAGAGDHVARRRRLGRVRGQPRELVARDAEGGAVVLALRHGRNLRRERLGQQRRRAAVVMQHEDAARGAHAG